MSEQRQCIVHYSNQVYYSKIKELSGINQQRILDAKLKRERIAGDKTFYKPCVFK